MSKFLDHMSTAAIIMTTVERGIGPQLASYSSLSSVIYRIMLDILKNF